MFLTQIVLINLNLVAQIIAVKDFIVCLIWTDFRCFFCNLANLRFIIATNISVGRGWSPKFATGQMVVLWLFLVFFCHLHVYPSQSWGSDGLNLNWFKSYQRNTKNVFLTIAKKWKYLHFVSQLLNQLSFSPFQHLKMWKIFLQVAKNWLEMVVKRPFVSRKFWWSVSTLFKCEFTVVSHVRVYEMSL